ncbi:CpsD/CapB family tyrosine-protein kinase [Aggregatilineales bacterium SYSU G02658]
MAQPNLITLTNPDSAASEAFRSLRTNIMFANVDNPIRTLLVTAASKDETTSETVANLAVTIAQSGNRTILVDANLRTPSQHTIWSLPNETGLSNMMQDERLLAQPPVIASGVDNLEILTAGTQPANPADLLISRRMSDIITILKSRASYVLFDSPPVLSATDAALLANKLDGVLLAVRQGKTRRDDVSRARAALAQVQANVIGAVLTHAAR